MSDRFDILERIDSLITAVYRLRTVKPWKDGNLRAARFERLFRDRLTRWPLRNQTDLVHGGSTAIAFLLHPGHYIGVATRDGIEVRIRRLGGQCFQALVEISHLGPYARIRFTMESLDDDTGRITYEEQETTFRDEDDEFLHLLRTVLFEENIEILTQDILDRPVPDVALDVTDIGNVTIYHCLFDEE